MQCNGVNAKLGRHENWVKHMEIDFEIGGINGSIRLASNKMQTGKVQKDSYSDTREKYSSKLQRIRLDFPFPNTGCTESVSVSAGNPEQTRCLPSLAHS